MIRTRRHDIDALRVFAFALLILYHTAMAYVGDWDFHIKSAYTADWLQWPMIFVNRWRMCLLFLISGAAIALAAPEGRLLRFARERTWRLMLPLIFGMFVVVPIQPYCEGVASGHLTPGFLHFLLSYWHVHPWPKDSFTGWQFGITWNHLWYLPYLWTYTLGLVVLMPFLGHGRVHAAVAAFCRAPAWLLIGAPTALLLFYILYLAPTFPGTNAYADDWYQHAKYASIFLGGYLLAREAGFWSRVAALRKATLAVALASIALYLGLRLTGQLVASDSWVYRVPEPFWTVLSQAAQSLYLWTALLAILGWGKVVLDRPFPWLPYCTEAVYPWYMLHQSLIILLVFCLKPMALGPWLEPALVLAGTITGCYVLHEFVIRRVGFIRPLFGLKALRKIETGDHAAKASRTPCPPVGERR
ncbi:acyltransferase family protein [Luteibacter jiangsuensis]|uniref:Acyltransferase family protein n=1 Tax=Luteibacter jiangsuensis TaxID=637577 RepID=A0ABX0Q3E3_9GAMM|nr:acyltransferase family protein [Luteibacter jiangsuensis]NID04490.1 acyltransferase family protein [Luteibacter jiangsuensis]